MTYIKVLWKHKNPEEPILLYSELDDERWEVRKVEVYSDGRLGYADRTSSSGLSGLGELPVPPLEEIASNSEFDPIEISKNEFEVEWAKRVIK